MLVVVLLLLGSIAGLSQASDPPTLPASSIAAPVKGFNLHGMGGLTGYRMDGSVDAPAVYYGAAYGLGKGGNGAIGEVGLFLGTYFGPNSDDKLEEGASVLLHTRVWQFSDKGHGVVGVGIGTHIYVLGKGKGLQKVGRDTTFFTVTVGAL